MNELEPLSLLARAMNAERHVQRLEAKYNAFVDLIAVAAGAWIGLMIQEWARPAVGWLLADGAFVLESDSNLKPNERGAV